MRIYKLFAISQRGLSTPGIMKGNSDSSISINTVSYSLPVTQPADMCSDSQTHNWFTYSKHLRLGLHASVLVERMGLNSLLPFTSIKQANHSLGHGFFICKMEVIIVTTSQSCEKDKMRKTM